MADADISPPERTRKQTKGARIMILFSLPFTLIGLWMLVIIGQQLCSWAAMRSWPEVPARILSAELNVSYGNDDSQHRAPIWQAQALYEYQWQGRALQGSRVGLSKGADNAGSFHQRVYNQLRSYRDSHALFRCYVNPRNPAESILYRDLRPEILALFAVAALVFGGVGILCGGLGVRALRNRPAQERLETEHPAPPWLWNKEWRDGHIRAHAGGSLFSAFLVAIIWNAFAFPILFLKGAELLRSRSWIVLFPILFPLVGIFLAFLAIRTLLRYLRFGESEFELTPPPGVIGGALRGVIRNAHAVRPEGGFQLKLCCVKTVVHRSGSGSNTISEQIVWKTNQAVPTGSLPLAPDGMAIPVEIAIPKGLPESSIEERINWRLEVHASLPGADYAARFLVPVYQVS